MLILSLFICIFADCDVYICVCFTATFVRINMFIIFTRLLSGKLSTVSQRLATWYMFH